MFVSRHGTPFQACIRRYQFTRGLLSILSIRGMGVDLAVVFIMSPIQGDNYETFPVNSYETEARRLTQF